MMTKMRKGFILTLIILSLTALGFGARPPLSIPASEVILDNGLTVLIHENHNLPLVSLKAMVKTGSVYEPEEKAGLASFAGLMLTKGTKTKSAEQIASQIEFVGGNLSASGGGTNSYIDCQVLKKDLDLALDLFSDVIINPSFDPKEMERERDLILSGIRSRKDNPEALASLEFMEIIYEKHPYHRPASGYEETVKGITRKDLIDFHQIFYVPGNTILAIAGDVDAEILIKKVKEKFGAWPKKAVEFPEFPAVSRQDEIKEKTIFMEREQAHIFLGHLGIRRTNPDYYALLVMDTILGAGGMSARIPHNLRDIKGLAYTAYSDISSSAGLEPGQFVAYMAVSPENTDKAISGLLEEIKRIRDEPVSSQELEDAKSYLRGSYFFGFQRNSALADYLIFCKTFNLGFDYIEKSPRYIDQVTQKDVQKAAQKYLHPEAYSLVVVGPANFNYR